MVKNPPVMQETQETQVQSLGWEDPMEKKCKKAKWLSGKALQIAVGRREAAFSSKRPEVTPKNGVLFTQLRKPHKIMQIKRFKSLCSL